MKHVEWYKQCQIMTHKGRYCAEFPSGAWYGWCISVEDVKLGIDKSTID